MKSRGLHGNGETFEFGGCGGLSHLLAVTLLPRAASQRSAQAKPQNSASHSPDHGVRIQ